MERAAIREDMSETKQFKRWKKQANIGLVPFACLIPS